jgi:sulfatase maturation enzyme AslB (radical SAM superfamily)
MSDLWCPLAFINASVKTSGNITTCCHGEPVVDKTTGQPITRFTHTIHQAFYSPEFQEIRDNLNNGIKDKHCQRCWSLEEMKVESPRQTELRYADFDHAKGNPATLEILDISLGNQCNLKCRTCGPTDSSYWSKEYYDIDLKETQPYQDYQKTVIMMETVDSKFVEDLKTNSLPTAKELHFFGGEPLLMKSTWDILNYAVSINKADDLILSFNTNGTVWNEKTSIFNKFKEVDLALSVDGLFKRFEYMRHPASWEQVSENIDSMCRWRDENSKKVDLVLCHTISSYNIWYIQEVLEYAQQRGITFWANIVFDPNNFAIHHIPQSIKTEIITHLSSITVSSQHDKSELDKIINHLQTTEADENKWQDFLSEVMLRDNYRRESFEKTFPEYYELIKSKGYL